MNYSHRIFLYGPVGLFAILMLGIMGYWFVASNAVAQKLDAANGRQIAPGITVSFARKTMGGFPFRIDSELDGLRVEIATSHGPTVWTAEHFAFHSLTYGRPQYILEAAGNQDVAWHDDAGQQHTYRFLPGALRASVISDSSGISRFDLDLIDAASSDVAAARVQLHLRRDPKVDGLDIVISADGIRIDPDLHPAFGPDAKTFRVETLVSPGTSFDGLLTGHADWRAAAEDWRRRDGGILVNSLAMNWGKLDITGKGAMSVDGLHRPLGALQLKIGDWRSLVQQAQQGGRLSGPNNGLGAGFFAFAGNAQSTEDKPLAATLGFKDGILFVGTVPADTLSPLY